MKVLDTPLPEVKLIEPRVLGDERGFFVEVWNHNRYIRSGIDATFRQANLDDRELGVDWPIAEPEVSAKDAAAPSLAELASAGALPVHSEEFRARHPQ